MSDPRPTPTERRAIVRATAETMWREWTAGQGRHESVPWLALPAEDRDRWITVADVAVTAAEGFLVEVMRATEDKMRDRHARLVTECADLRSRLREAQGG